MNRPCHGDNLDVMREHVASESVDLAYLDPPFDSNANYDILFKSPARQAADSQIEAFEDSWHWNDKAESAFHDVITSGNIDGFHPLDRRCHHDDIGVGRFPSVDSGSTPVFRERLDMQRHLASVREMQRDEMAEWV